MRIRTLGAGALTVVVMFLFAAGAAAFPAVGSEQVPADYGEYRLVEDMNGGLWTRDGWLAKPDNRPAVKSFGYRTEFAGLAATVWRDTGKGGVPGREMVIFDRPFPLRDLSRYSRTVHRLAAAADSEVYIAGGHYRQQLAILAGGGTLVRFYFADSRDTTRPNSHALIKGFEMRMVQADRRGKPKMDGVSAVTDGEWRKTENIFAPGLHFSERLVVRRVTDTIVVHHTKIPDMTVESIHDLHLANGWAGIGYHKVVLPDGAVAAGRPEHTVGAHALGVNRRSVGIVGVGDFDAGRPSPAQFAAMIAVTAATAVKYGVTAERILPHRGVYDDTTCPGRLFPWEEFSAAVRVKLGQQAK